MNTLPSSALDSVERVSDGPLAGFEIAYRCRLVERGYTACTQRNYFSCFAHFASWTARQGVRADELCAALVVRFVDDHLPNCRCFGRVQRHRAQVRAALRQLLPVLIDAGCPSAVPEPNAVECELNRFDTYLRDQRGLAKSTRIQRRRIVGELLRQTTDGKGGLRTIDAVSLRAFIAAKLERWSPSSAAVLAGALRAYLRYRALAGDSVAGLLPVITSPACWRFSSLPETLSTQEVERVLGSFDVMLPSRRRAAAIAQCVARLGLRSSEVVGLELEDLDWDSGTIRLRRCKSRRTDVLPMPVSVGAAIVEYLHDERPACTSRRVFVRHVAPVEEPLGPNIVGRIIRAAYSRCGLPYTRVHIFRHSLAARVLDAGGTLKEVADVLRHRNLDTTQIYAKVDQGRLSAVAMAWPGSAS